MKDMAGKTVVITGAANGIGFACAKGLIDDGADVLGVDIKEEGLKELEALGAITMVVDVSDQTQVNAMIEKATTDTGRIDVLFNNAGYGILSRVEDYIDGQFEKMIAVHVFGAKTDRSCKALKRSIPLSRCWLPCRQAGRRARSSGTRRSIPCSSVACRRTLA